MSNVQSLFFGGRSRAGCFVQLHNGCSFLMQAQHLLPCHEAVSIFTHDQCAVNASHGSIELREFWCNIIMDCICFQKTSFDPEFKLKLMADLILRVHMLMQRFWIHTTAEICFRKYLLCNVRKLLYSHYNCHVMAWINRIDLKRCSMT